MRMRISCLLLRSPKRIADEAELVSGFTEVDFSCFCGVLPGFFVDVADFLDERKEMSDFSVEEVVGSFVEEENEWANASGWTFGGRESFSAFGHCNEMRGHRNSEPKHYSRDQPVEDRLSGRREENV